MKTIALIPARKGSKRIPGKNLALLGGKPLLQWTIEAAKESGVFDTIVVSSDWHLCRIMAADSMVSCIGRPPELCTDTSHDYEWVKHALDAFSVPDLGAFDIFVILRPTSPFRTAATIRRAIRCFDVPPLPDSMRAVEKTSCHPRKSWVHSGGRIFPFMDGKTNGFPDYDMSTQSLGEVWVQNGCIHVAQVKTLEKFGNVSGEVIRPFFTEGREGMDINTPGDLQYAEWLLGRETILDVIDMYRAEYGEDGRYQEAMKIIGRKA